MLNRKFAAPLLLALVCAAVLPNAARAQFGSLGNLVKSLPIKAPALPNVLSGPEPVSTSLKDATYGDPAKDGFTPSGPATALTDLPRTAQGGFVLRAGYFTMLDQSYCLHAGTHGPGGGDGYLYAPVKGSAQAAVTSILHNSVAHPEIAQHDIQLLLWAIVAKAKFEDLDSRLKLVAATLLDQRQLATLNRSALGMLTGPELSRLTGGMPAPLRAVAEAESRMRGLLATPGSSYADIERVAVLGGAVPRGAGSADVPSTRWSLHPDGYWERFRPNGYTNTVVEIWVPAGSAGVGKVYDPGTQIAVPGNTSRQRLAQSGRVYQR